MTFAEHMRNARGDLSQRAFCRKLGIPLITYQRYETGLRVPGIDVFVQIVKRTGISADTLLGLKHKTASQETKKPSLRALSKLSLAKKKTSK